MSTDTGSAASIPTLFSRLPPRLSAAADLDRPWELLGDPLDEILDELPSSAIEVRLHPDARIVGDRVAIGRRTRIEAGVVVEGPVWIGEGVLIRPGAYVRAGCWIGDGSVVGANTELKRAVLLPGAKVPHLSYVGDSILGSDVNLGAGTVLSNFRHDGGEVEIPVGGDRISTGRRKLGSILGDGVQTGCNCVLSPGVVVGRETRIYAGVVLRPGIYPANSIIKLRQELIVAPRNA